MKVIEIQLCCIQKNLVSAELDGPIPPGALKIKQVQ